MFFFCRKYSTISRTWTEFGWWRSSTSIERFRTSNWKTNRCLFIWNILLDCSNTRWNFTTRWRFTSNTS